MAKLFGNLTRFRLGTWKEIGKNENNRLARRGSWTEIIACGSWTEIIIIIIIFFSFPHAAGLIILIILPLHLFMPQG